MCLFKATKHRCLPNNLEAVPDHVFSYTGQIKLFVLKQEFKKKKGKSMLTRGLSRRQSWIWILASEDYLICFNLDLLPGHSLIGIFEKSVLTCNIHCFLLCSRSDFSLGHRDHLSHSTMIFCSPSLELFTTTISF